MHTNSACFWKPSLAFSLNNRGYFFFNSPPHPTPPTQQELDPGVSPPDRTPIQIVNLDHNNNKFVKTRFLVFPFVRWTKCYYKTIFVWSRSWLVINSGSLRSGPYYHLTSHSRQNPNGYDYRLFPDTAAWISPVCKLNICQRMWGPCYLPYPVSISKSRLKGGKNI